MSTVISPTDIGSALTGAAPIVPVVQAGTGTLASVGVDRTSGDASAPYESCAAVAVIGANVGGVTGSIVTVSIEDSADNSSFAAYTDPTTGALASKTVGTGTTVPASGTILKLNVNLKGARQFVREKIVSTQTGGTSVALAGLLILGGATVVPTP